METKSTGRFSELFNELHRMTNGTGHAAPSREVVTDYDNGQYAQVGRLGESLVASYLNYVFHDEYGPTVRIVDLRHDKAMQHADVDFLVTLPSGNVIFTEVKTDTYLGMTGNVLFETMRIYGDSPADMAFRLAWGPRSAATWLIIWAPNADPPAFFHCRMASLRHVARCHVMAAVTAGQPVNVKWVPTSENTTTECILVPWDECESIFRVTPWPPTDSEAGANGRSNV